jgi:LysR family transcriptional activator of nhaA
MTSLETGTLNFHHLHYFRAVAHAGSIARAVETLGVAPATVSEQLRQLERDIGVPLLVRRGRSLAVTPQGHLVLRYADEIHALGRALLTAARTEVAGRPLRFAIGVADSLPKLTVARLIAPALALGPLWRVSVRTAPTARLIADLAADAVDLVIADQPMPAGSRTRAYNHRLGDSGITVFATLRRAAALAAGFPQSLQGAPMLMPAEGSPLRRSIEAWLLAQGLEPDVVAEVDDLAILQHLGHDGVGVFGAPSVVAEEIERTYAVRAVGELRRARETFWAVTAERQLRHPGVLAVVDAARSRLATRGRRRR